MTLKSALLCSTFACLALPSFAEEKRELGAHVHGHGALNIALDGNMLAMELEVPGFDIVGFEHAAESDADKAAIDAGLAQLGKPLELFQLPDDAGCQLAEAFAELHGEDDGHEEHDDAHHDDDDHGHDDHKDEHAHDGEEKDDHDDHDAHKDEHAHDDHDGHDDHDEAGSHSEFHAEYTFDCKDPSKLTKIDLTYFQVFANAKELEVQIVSASGAKKAEVSGDAPVLSLN